MDLARAIATGQVKIAEGGSFKIGGRSKRTDDGTAFTSTPAAVRRAKRREANRRAKLARRKSR